MTAPALAARLGTPAAADALAGLEREFGRALPDALRAFYTFADGDGPAIEDETNIHGLLLGPTLGPHWIRGMRWLSVREATAQLRECRDTIAESFARSWIPIATDDNGNFVIVDAENGSVFGIDHESPEERLDNRLAPSVVDLLEDLVRGIDGGMIRCDRTGLFRIVAPGTAPPDRATAFVGLLVERGVLVLANDRAIDEAVPAVRGLLAGHGRVATRAKKLAMLFEEAAWVDETFASEEVLEVLLDEFR